MSGLSLANSVIVWITVVLSLVSGLVGVFAAADAGSRRPDAYTAADKQTKGQWMGITLGCAVVLVLGALGVGLFSATSLFWAAAMVGSLVYLLDVRPRLREVQRGSRW